MKFKLSKRSLRNLDGVDERLQKVCLLAITKTKVDFGVICGLRTKEEQAELVRKGASQTQKSKHLTGHAVDLMAYAGKRASWEVNMYDEIADAVKEASIELELDVPIRWGAAWSIDNLADWDGTAENAMNSYIDLRRSQGRRPFIDSPHFELML